MRDLTRMFSRGRSSSDLIIIYHIFLWILGPLGYQNLIESGSGGCRHRVHPEARPIYVC